MLRFVHRWGSGFVCQISFEVLPSLLSTLRMSALVMALAANLQWTVFVSTVRTVVAQILPRLLDVGHDVSNPRLSNIGWM